MTAIQILREALFSILRNWRQVIQIFLIPLGLVVALGVGILLFGTQTVVIDGRTAEIPSLFVFAFIPVFLFLIFWPVVAWHRFLVLDEQPIGFIPQFRPYAVLRYVLNLVGLSLLLALILLPILAFIVPVMIRGINFEAMLSGGMPPLSFFILPALASLPALYLGIRWCLILPGAAVDNRIGLSGSWNSTSGKNSVLIPMIILGLAVSIISQIMLSAVTPVLPGAGQTTLIAFEITQFVAQTLSSLFALSMMSTMFLAFVEDEKPK